MKLFVWEPQGHGSYTVSVVAENLEIAQKLADSHVKNELVKNNNDYGYSGWGTSYYELNIVEAGVVVIHAND